MIEVKKSGIDLKRYRVSFDVEVETEVNPGFRPGCRTANIVGTDTFFVNDDDESAIRSLFRFAFQGHYPYEKWLMTGQDADHSLPITIVELTSGEKIQEEVKK